MRLFALALIAFAPACSNGGSEPPPQPRGLTEVEKMAQAFGYSPLNNYEVNADNETTVSVLVDGAVVEARYGPDLSTIYLRRDGVTYEGDPAQIDYVVRAAYTRVIQMIATGAM